jgi:uncharacterized repeat protein (TIGR01451 family)
MMIKARSAFAISSLVALLVSFGLPGCSSDSTAPEPDRADLSIAKSDEADPVTVGDEVVYTITVSNAGPEDATGVSVTDAVPSGTDFESASASQGSCTQAGGTMTCDLGSLASGANTTVTLTLTANQVGTVSNTASVTGDQEDPNGGNNSDTETTTVSGVPADLSITKSAQAGSVRLGEQIVYTITVVNAGPGEATDVQVTDPVPALTSFVSASTTRGSCSESGGTVTCDLGDFANGGRATITLNVRAEEIGVAENAATVAANEPDPNEGDNTDSESTGIVQGPPSDLSITKVAKRDPVAVGDSIVYTIIARNLGPNDVAAVIVIDTLPSGTTLISATPTRGECTVAGGILTCDVGSLGVFVTATVTLTVRADELGTVINRAVVAGSVQDTAQANNTATDTTRVTPLADLSVTKNDAADPVPVGDEVVYTIDVVNRGPNEATAATVTDTLPSGLDFDDVATTGGTCDETRDVVTCDLGAMAPGDSVRVTITTISHQVGTLTNRASAFSAVEDPDLDNNTDLAITRVTGPQADLTISKSDRSDPVTVGQDIIYDINVLNLGPDDVANATVTDPVPAGTTFVSATISPGSCSEAGGIVTCTIPTLPSGVGTTITLKVTANQAGPVTNTATVNPPPTVEDPNLNNNSNSETTTVN